MNEILTPEQRIRRIAGIIDKGIYLLALKEGWFADPVKKENRATQIKALDFKEQQVIDLYKRKGRITNRHVQDLFGVHRNTATKRLKDMVLKGLLIPKGNNRHTYYIENVHRAKNVHRIDIKISR